jgi:hypothetical protein
MGEKQSAAEIKTGDSKELTTGGHSPNWPAILPLGQWISLMVAGLLTGKPAVRSAC